jgi:hypothetical protein
MPGQIHLGRFRTRSNLVGSPQHLSAALADDDAGSHSVAGGHAWHEGLICDAKVLNSIDLKIGIDDLNGIARHFCGTRLMVVSSGRIADELYQCSSF